MAVKLEYYYNCSFKIKDKTAILVAANAILEMFKKNNISYLAFLSEKDLFIGIDNSYVYVDEEDNKYFYIEQIEVKEKDKIKFTKNKEINMSNIEFLYYRYCNPDIKTFSGYNKKLEMNKEIFYDNYL